MQNSSPVKTGLELRKKKIKIILNFGSSIFLTKEFWSLGVL